MQHIASAEGASEENLAILRLQKLEMHKNDPLHLDRHQKMACHTKVSPPPHFPEKWGVDSPQTLKNGVGTECFPPFHQKWEGKKALLHISIHHCSSKAVCLSSFNFDMRCTRSSNSCKEYVLTKSGKLFF